MKSDTSYKPENGDQLGESYNRDDAELYALYNLLDYDELHNLCRTWHIAILITELSKGFNIDISSRYNRALDDLKKFVQERNMEDVLSHVTEESRNHYYNLLFHIFIYALQNQNRENAGAVDLSTKLRQIHSEKCPTFNFLYVPELGADGVSRKETSIEIFCREFAIPIKLCFFNQFSKDVASDKEFDEIDSALMQKHSERLEQLVAKKNQNIRIYNIFSVSELSEIYSIWRSSTLASMLVMRIVGNNNSNITEYRNIQLLQFNGIVTNYDLEKYESLMRLSLPIKDADFPCYNYLHSVYWVFMTALQVELNLPKENEFSILLDKVLLQHLIDFPNCEELHNIPGINGGEMNLTQIAIFKEQKVCTKVTNDAKRVVEKDVANQSESVANHSII